MFQHTAARRRLVGKGRFYGQRWGFNTQPPEGGCQDGTTGGSGGSGFNTQPPEGGCARNYRKKVRRIVSTHSRPKAAEFGRDGFAHFGEVSTHSRPKAAALAIFLVSIMRVFQHTAARRRLQDWNGLKMAF